MHDPQTSRHLLVLHQAPRCILYALLTVFLELSLAVDEAAPLVENAAIL